METPRSATILVVEDDPGVREAFHLILDDDYEVLDAIDSHHALAMLASQKIDLVLLDLILEHSDGLVVLERLSEEQKKVPIVVVSGLNNTWATAAAMRLGAVDYVAKPFDEREVLQLIRDTLAPSMKLTADFQRRCLPIPALLLVGLDLGIYASLAVILRQHYRVARADTVLEALSSREVSSTKILALDLSSLGPQAPAVLRQLDGYFAGAQFVVIGHGDEVPRTFRTLRPPARVSDLVTVLTDSLTADSSLRYQYDARTRSALDYLGANYVEASVRRVARAVSASPNYLSACFRKATGRFLKSYITELRVEAAKWLLSEAGEKIETAALRVGLHDASHLSKVFVRYAGARPGAYRRRRVLASSKFGQMP